VTLCDQCAAAERARVMSGVWPSAEARGSASSARPAPPTVREDELVELRERVADIEGQRTEVVILGVARLLWSNWELDDRLSMVESVRTGSRYLLILGKGPDTPEPADVDWLVDRQQEWRAAIEEIDRLIEMAESGRPPAR
jgi:hypothetical protein